MKYLVAGLGNIGAEYENTRHNIGFTICDHLAEAYGGSFVLEKLAMHATIKTKGKTIHLIKPTTYMNLSGKALNYWLQFLKIDVSNTIVATDDIALPLGKIRIRPQGSSGGHNGLKNIQEVLGTDAYTRLRFGVGGDFAKGQQVQYVLGTFDKQEEPLLQEKVKLASEAIVSFCLAGLQKTMTDFNK